MSEPQVLDTSYRVVPDFFRCGSFYLLFSSGGKSNENYTAALKTSLKEILSFKDGDFIEKSCSNLSARSYRNAAKYCTVSRLDRGTALSFLSRKGINGKDPSLPHAEEGRAYRADNGRYYINQEIQNGADDTLSRCIWVLLDFIEQVEYHTAGEFPVEVLCFANGQLYEIVPIPRGKETMLCQLLRLPQKDAGKRLVVVDDAEQIDALDIPHTAGFCTVAADGTVSYYRKEADI